MSQNGRKRDVHELSSDVEGESSAPKAPKIDDEEDDDVVFLSETAPPERPREKFSFISWNVNKAGNIFNTHAGLQDNWPEDYDVILLLDTQGQQTAGDSRFDMFYKIYLPACSHDGKSMCLLTKKRPIKVFCELNSNGLKDLNRVIIAVFSSYVLFCVNAPDMFDNSEEKKDLRQEYEEVLLDAFLLEKYSGKPIIFLGDFNVAHNLDLDMDDTYVDKTKEIPGFTAQEIASFKLLLKHGLADTFREMNGDRKVMTANVGEMRPPFINSRSSYILVSRSIMNTVTKADILTDDNMMYQPIVAELSLERMS